MQITDFYGLPTLFTIDHPLWFLISEGFLQEIGNQKVLNKTSREQIEAAKIPEQILINVVSAQQANLYSNFLMNQWKVASVWYKGNPIMIIRNVLYFPQDSYPKQFITDAVNHNILCWSIVNLLKEDPVINNSIWYFNPYCLFGDHINNAVQVLNQPQVYDTNLATEAINYWLGTNYDE